MDDTATTEGLRAPEIDHSSPPRDPTTAMTPDDETVQHLKLFSADQDVDRNADRTDGFSAEIIAAPMFSSSVKAAFKASESGQKPSFPAYGLLGMRTATFNRSDDTPNDLPPADNLIYANLEYPWSAFVCGQQDAGKSHTMSCLLENALLSNNGMGPNPKRMAGVVFHHDKFTSSKATQVCEAAYLCSKGIKVQVLVSISNLESMKEQYQNLPDLPKGSPMPEVVPLLFEQNQLNVASMKNLMGIDNDDKSRPLYMSVVNKVLKQLSVKPGAGGGVNFTEMKELVTAQNLTPAQTTFLDMRYQLIEWFLKDNNETDPVVRNIKRRAGKIKFEPGTVLIVDLSCPFVTESDACTLFSIFLGVFQSKRHERPLIIALDEAHKFLTESPAAKAFTDDLLSIVRQQRHLATRVLIATQEPSISPQLLDLCNVAIVHRFQSPQWYPVLRKHLAALALHQHGENGADEVFRTIVKLKQGEALVFCPQACFDVDRDGNKVKFRQMEDGYAKIKIRKKITADGGRSIVASDAKSYNRGRREQRRRDLRGDSGTRGRHGKCAVKMKSSV